MLCDDQGSWPDGEVLRGGGHEVCRAVAHILFGDSLLPLYWNLLADSHQATFDRSYSQQMPIAKPKNIFNI